MFDDCYEDTKHKIQNKVKGKNIWCSIDETIDDTGRYIANIMIGSLQIDKPENNFLLV